MKLAIFSKETKSLEISEWGGRQILKIDEERSIPLFDKPTFWAQLIQPGSAKKNKGLAKYISGFYFPKYALAADTQEGETPEITSEMVSMELKVLPIGIFGYQRVYMPPFDPANTKPLCQSRDGVWPSPFIEMPYAQKCATWVNTKKGPQLKVLCPEATWSKPKTAPPCSVTKLLCLFDLERSCPIILPLKGKNYSVDRNLMDTADVVELQIITRGERIEDYGIKITATNEGNYCQMRMVLAKMPEMNPGKYMGAAAWYRENMLPEIGMDPERPESHNTLVEEAAASAVEVQGPVQAIPESGGAPDLQDFTM